MGVHSVKDAEGEGFATARRGEGAHLANAPGHFDKEWLVTLVVRLPLIR